MAYDGARLHCTGCMQDRNKRVVHTRPSTSAHCRVVVLRMRLTLACALFLCANGWKQDRFAISIWVDPVVPPEEFPARYAEMRRANISVLLGGFGATTPETVAASLQACEQNGLMAIVSTCGGGSWAADA